MRALLLLAAVSCGDDVGDFQQTFPLGECGTVEQQPILGARHVPQGSFIDFSGYNPPASGNHFATWAAYDRQYVSLDRGFWVHDAEHGAVVLLHRCDPAACPDVVQQLVAAASAFPADDACTDVKNRVIVAFDPLLPEGIEVGAVAWGKAYTATCVDPVAIDDFRAMFYAHGPEATCANGAVLGGTPIE